MKRACAAALLLAALLMGLCACAQQQQDSEPLPRLVIGSDDYEPYNYIDENGQFAGIDVELAREAFRRMGYEPEFRRIVWENKDSYLDSGEVDCLWGCFTMTGRETLYDWVGPYLNSRQIICVRADSDIAALSDLEGRRVAVQATSKPESVFLERTDPRIPAVGDLYCFSTMDEVYSALRKGYADAIAGHENALQVMADAEPGTYRILDESLFCSQLGVAFAKGSHGEIIQQLSLTLREMIDDGTAREIVARYGLDADEALGGV